MLPTTRRRLLVTTAAAAVCLSAVGGVAALGGAAADAATPTAPTATPSATHARPRLSAAERTDVRRIEHAMPGSFRRALREAEHHRTAAERKDAVAALERHAVSGTYGDTVRTVVQDAVQAGTSSLPSRTAARVEAIEGGRRTDLRRDVRVFLRRALDGRYGSTLQHELEQLGQGLPACRRARRAPVRRLCSSGSGRRVWFVGVWFVGV